MTSFDSASLRFWTNFEEIGFWLVIIGVFGESVELMTKLAAWRFKKHFTERAHRWLLIIEVVFWLLLIIGLGMEFLGGHRARIISEAENTRLNVLAGQLNDRASSNDLARLRLEKELLQLKQTSEQTRSNVFKIDPRKQEIVEVSAKVWFTTRGTNAYGAWSGDKLTAFASSFDWGKFPEVTTNIWKLVLTADNCERSFWTGGFPRYDLNFHMQSLGRLWNLQGALVEDADEWDAICLGPMFLPFDSEILEGHATIVINGSFTKEIPIPPQRPHLPVITARIHNGEVTGFGVGQGGSSGPPIKLK